MGSTSDAFRKSMAVSDTLSVLLDKYVQITLVRDHHNAERTLLPEKLSVSVFKIFSQAPMDCTRYHTGQILVFIASQDFPISWGKPCCIAVERHRRQREEYQHWFEQTRVLEVWNHHFSSDVTFLSVFCLYFLFFLGQHMHAISHRGECALRSVYLLKRN